jgi:hypothetical protein
MEGPMKKMIVAFVAVALTLIGVRTAAAQEPKPLTCDEGTISIVGNVIGARILGYVYGYALGFTVGRTKSGAVPSEEALQQEKKVASLHLTIGVAAAALAAYCRGHRTDTLDAAMDAVETQFIQQAKLDEVP